MIKEGDFVMGMTSEGMIHGMVEHIMFEGGVYGVPGTEYAIQSMPPENPAMAVRIYEEEDDMDSEVAMAMYDSSIGKSHSCNSSSSLDKAYEGCGCPTCKELNVNCDNCPVCQEEDMNKAKPNYGDMIKPRRGGSTPSNPKLYARVVQAAKDKFEVYPSAVANSWVVQEYKRRGGTYKSEKALGSDNFWNGFLK